MLWNEYSHLDWQAIPPKVQTIARQCLLDWLGCALAGSKEPLATILREEYVHQSGRCSVIGTDLKVPAQIAALINGCQGHALDFDDTSTVMGGHPSAPVIPAVIAQGEDLSCSGQDLLTAIVVGIEFESRLGILVGPEHYAKGWHVTSTMGVFGAAAGVSWLLKLDDESFGHAMGLAASQASGLKSNFGTMTKPFHAGHAAERGLLSARLAARGFTANVSSFEGDQGLLEAASNGVLHEQALEAYKGEWLSEHVLFKYHAACYLTHATIEALLHLGNSVSADNCEEIVVTVNASLLDVCGIENPVSGLEAKFSLRAAAALTVFGYDTTDSNTYTDEIIKEESLAAMIQRVTVQTDDSLTTTQTSVVVRDKQGEQHQASFDTGIPCSDLQDQQGKLESKFHQLLGSDTYSKRLQQRVREIELLEDIRGFLD